MFDRRFVACLALIVTACSAAPASQPNAATRTIYLVRHGFYDYNDDRDPDVGKALVPLGVAQARLVAARMKGLPVEFTSFYSSTMTRARETADVIHQDFPQLDVQKTRLLRECTPDTWRKEVITDEDPADMESCRQRLDEAFDKFFVPAGEREANDLLVCHGNVIRYFVTKALGVDPLAWLGMSVANCSITVIRVDPDGRCKVLSVGDVGHIPPNMQTGTDRREPVLVVPGD